MLFIEGMIRFLEVYSINEIGEAEVDIEKVSLWVNSPYFENVCMRRIRNANDVYKTLERMMLDHQPLYRFLRLTPSQMAIQEKQHRLDVLSDYEDDCKKRPCLKCLWYQCSVTALGPLEKCRLHDRNDILRKRGLYRNFFDSSSIKSCKCLTTLDHIPKCIIDYDHKWAFSRNVEKIPALAVEYRTKIANLDNSIIPADIPNAEKVDLSGESSLLVDFGRGFNNKQSMDDMRSHLRQAIMMECMIGFVEVFAQTEFGNDYQANIRKIARWVFAATFSFKCKDEAYNILEEMSEKELRCFVSRKEK